MDEDLLWSILGDGDNPDKQIAVSHLTKALSPYSTTSQMNTAISEAVKDYIPLSQKGRAGGVVPLDNDGLISSMYLPSYVDDVLEYSTFSALPVTGESGKIYVTLDTNLTYRWSGTSYVEISKSLALGETADTAYAGNKGKENRDSINRLKNATFWGATYQANGNVYGTFNGTEIYLTNKIETPKIKIGDIFLEYDAERNAIKGVKYNSDGAEEMANFYMTGGITALGIRSSGGISFTLQDLADTNISNPQDKQALVYDAASQKWINGQAIGGGDISLNGTVYKPVNGVITLPGLYEKVAGGTSSQFLKADGSVDGNLYALAYNGNQNKVQYSYHSRLASYLQVIDRRSEVPKPNSYESYNISAFFNMARSNGMPDDNWWSGFHVRGWGDDYCTWELIGPSSTNNTAYNLRYRTGIGDTWGDWKMIMTDVECDKNYVKKAGDTMTGNLNVPFISTAVNPDNQGNYFYSSDDTFIRRSTWHAALSHLSQKQLTLDLTSLDQNKWYPCIIGTPAFGGTPLRITLFNGLRGNKPTWGSHDNGFSLLLDYEVTGSGWGTLSAIAKLNWYFGSYGGETAFGGRQQNTMASAEIIYLRGGGIYYYRTTNGQELAVQPNGYTWSSGSYNYSAPVKTSQDNSPMEKTFDQVYWAPNNLRNTRTIWGQSFNGTQNVSGALSGATTITATGDITTSANIGGRSIYASADLTAAGYTYCNGRLYVDRGRYSSTATPSISLAIGDTDTGFHWELDGKIVFKSNNKDVGYWNYSEGRLYNCYFREQTGNEYAATSMMINGNGSNLYPGIGFHQPGVDAAVLYYDSSYNVFKFRNINDTGYRGLYIAGIIAHGSINPGISNQDLGTPYLPWRQAYINNMHGSADAAGMLNTAYIGGQQPNPQTYFGLGTGLKVAMTGSIKPWNDTLWINGYSGGDVKSMCALHTMRNGTPEMYISTQLSDATAYGTMYRFWTSYNSNKSDAAWTCSTLNARDQVLVGSYIQALGGVNCAGVLNSGGASGFNVYATFHGNGRHGGIEIGASDSVFGIGVHSDYHMYWWWTNSGSIGSSSNKSYIMDYGGGTWQFTGNIGATGGITAMTSSDENLKNRLDYEVDYASKLLLLGRVFDFTYNDKALARKDKYADRNVHTGLSWQKVRNILPTVCGMDKDGYGYINYISPDFISLIAGATQLNTLGIQSILNRTKSLEERVKILERRNEQLELKIKLIQR